jgi:hypothetical protein
VIAHGEESQEGKEGEEVEEGQKGQESQKVESSPLMDFGGPRPGDPG